MRTIIVSSYPNLRLLQLYGQTFSLSTISRSLISHFSRITFFRDFCFYFIPTCVLVQRAKCIYFFGYDRKHAINRNNCPKSLRKLFLLIIIIPCDNRFILLFFFRLLSRGAEKLFFLCHKSDNPWQRFKKKSVMIGQMTQLETTLERCLLKGEKCFNFQFTREIKRKFSFVSKKLSKFILLLNETFLSDSLSLSVVIWFHWQFKFANKEDTKKKRLRKKNSLI